MLITHSENHGPGLTCPEVTKAHGISGLKVTRGNDGGDVARGPRRNWEEDMFPSATEEREEDRVWR